MAEQNEGRGGRGAAVVLLYQLVPLELPDGVTVVLHYLERIAVEFETFFRNHLLYYSLGSSKVQVYKALYY